MKILFINLPYVGHFVPTVGLVQELIKRDCQVTYLMPYGWEDRVAESGADFQGYGNHKKLSEQIKNAYRAAEKMFHKYDGIVYEQFFFLGKHLAQKHGKPAVRIFTAPATNEKLMKAYLNAKGPLGIFRHKWIARSWTGEILKELHLENSLQTDNWLDEILHNPPVLNLVYTLREFQPYEEEFDTERYLFLGASAYERKGQDWSFEKQERPLIYISLGTVVKGKRRFFQSYVDAFKDEELDIILSTGPQFDKGKIKNIPENVHVYSFVPQVQVLKQADLFVTHGGMNSISEALICGVPLMVIPFMADQPVNARRVEELGLGVQMDYHTLDKTILKQRVLSLLKNQQIKDNVVRMQEKLCNAPGNAGGAEAILNCVRKTIQ